MRRLYSHALKRAWEYAGVLGTVLRRLIKFNPRITQILSLLLLPKTKYWEHKIYCLAFTLRSINNNTA